MNTEDLVKVCKDYGVTTDEFRHAAIAEMLLAEDDALSKQADLHIWMQKLQSVLDHKELVSAIKWASWIKKAKKEDKPGRTVEELLALRKAS